MDCARFFSRCNPQIRSDIVTTRHLAFYYTVNPRVFHPSPSLRPSATISIISTHGDGYTPLRLVHSQECSPYFLSGEGYIDSVVSEIDAVGTRARLICWGSWKYTREDPSPRSIVAFNRSRSRPRELYLCLFCGDSVVSEKATYMASTEFA